MRKDATQIEVSRQSAIFAIYSVLVVLLLGGCSTSAPPTPTPTKTPTTIPTATEPVPPTPSPTDTPMPSVAEESLPTPVAMTQALPTPPPLPPPPTRAPESGGPPPVTPEPTPVSTELPAVPVVIAPPAHGGDWDMEDGFYVWPSPYENFGGFVANGWKPFVIAHEPNADPPNAPRLNENKNLSNVHSGQRSQEISFDYRVGEAGLYRTVTVTPGHRYQIAAWARYTPTSSGLHLLLGVDLTGGDDATSDTVQWYPWRDHAPDRWLATEETVTADGNQMTIFLRAIHPAPVEGGNTMFDNVSLIDLGP